MSRRRAACLRSQPQAIRIGRDRSPISDNSDQVTDMSFRAVRAAALLIENNTRQK